MASQNYLIFDFGASNCRSIMAGYDGKSFSMDVTHRFENRPVFADGTLYWDILNLYQELKNGISASLKKYDSIKSMGLDAWGTDFGIIDKNGKLIANPVHYRDVKRAEDAKDLYTHISAEKLYELTGACIKPLFDVFHLYSLKKQNSPEIKNADKFLSIADIFNYFLTKTPSNELTRLTTSAFFNQFEYKLEEKIFDILGLPKNIFPGTVNPGEKISGISDDLAEELGIKSFDIIAPATHDTASAVAGIPVKYPDKNWAFISIGTWCSIGVENDRPIVTGDTFREGFCNEAGVEGKNIFVRNINGLWIIQQCMEKWRKDIPGFDWPDIDKIYPKAESFKVFIDVEDTKFLRTYSDMSEVINKYCAKTGQKLPESIGEISRSFYESLVLRFKYHMLKFERFTGKKLDILHVVGGGIKNRLFCQWISNALGIAIIAGPVETTSVGNLIMQLKANGEIDDLNQGRQISLGASDIAFYEPQDTQTWTEAYEKYLRFLNK